MARNQQKSRKGPHTVQDTIPYQRMWQDGVCRVTDHYYTKTIQFQDINYQLAQNDDKTSIFEGWCDFLNYFDSSIHLQLSFLNLTAEAEAFEQSILIPDKGDGFNDVRHEYAQMLQNQLVKGNNGLTKTKFITFGIEAENFKAAKPRLERIEIDLLNNFKRLGVSASPLDGRERLKLMHDMFHMDTQPFLFDWKWLSPSGLSTKDFIVPSSFDFRDKHTFGIGNRQGEVSFFSILASDLNDRCLADFLAMESSLIVSVHIQAIDQVAAIRDVKRKITDLDRMKIEEQKKAIRSGYDMDIIPSDLATYGGEAKKLLEDLQSRNERMFLITFLVMNTADNKKQLNLNVKQAQSIAQQHNCRLIPLDFQQENGMVSCLPLGYNAVKIQRGLTTSSTAIFIPFTSQELFQSTGEALYCGLNALSNNLIMVDRKKLKNPNGLILGTPGSGKSFAAKREISNVLLVTDDDIIICDPEGEYYPLVNTFHGQVIRISPTSSNYINPMDINLDYSDDDNPLSLKSDFILSLCELIVGGRDGLQPIEKTIIDRAVHIIYQPYLNDPRPENVPILEDLYNALRQQEEKERKENLYREMAGQEQQGSEPAEPEALKEKIEATRKEHQSVQEAYLKIYGDNRKNQEVLDRIRQYEDQDRDLQKRYEKISRLSKTANGTLSGSVKLDFETYVQRRYFKKIIQAANQRLARMAGGEFLLQCRDIEHLGSQGQAGLDLDVYHLASDSVRDVRTLSGGESFMASLAMALGLSDIVQNTAGAVSIDTMFVDEGFGALDDEAREQAVRVLADLAGEQRLVGIISHVNELKEQIDRKLVVKKTETGSTVHWEW